MEYLENCINNVKESTSKKMLIKIVYTCGKSLYVEAKKIDVLEFLEKINSKEKF